MDAKEIKLSEMIKLSVSATSTLEEFMSHSICPVFTKDENKSHFQAASMTTFNRMTLWLSDLSIAKEPIHFQVAAICMRSLFENLLDLKWLVANPKEADKFTAFTPVRRFDIADNIFNELERNPKIDRTWYASELKLATDLQSRIVRDELCRRNGWLIKNSNNTRKPKHWWGENTGERARLIDPDGRKEFQTYLKLYALLSNHVHPGGVSLIGHSAKGLANLFVGLHQSAQEFCLDATEIVCQHFPVPKDIVEEFHEKFFGDAPYC